MIPECLDDPKVFESEWLPYAVPYKNNKPKYCERYHMIEEANITNDANCSEINFDDRTVEACNKYVYKSDERTILIDVSTLYGLLMLELQICLLICCSITYNASQIIGN